MSRRDPAEFAEFATAKAGALHRAAYLMVGDAQPGQDLDDSSRGLAATADPGRQHPARGRRLERGPLPGRHAPPQPGCRSVRVVRRTHRRAAGSDAPGFEFAAPYEWLDNDTIAAVALPGTDETAPMSLLTCHVSTNDCEVTVPDVSTFPDITLPMGEAVGD